MKIFLLTILIIYVSADIFIQNPPGTNNRNREPTKNRANGNRLYDSQDNAAGGYPWRGSPTMDPPGPDPIVYYAGSNLKIQWINQHGCGPNENVHCEFIIQAGCEDTLPGLRDGYPSGDYQDLDPEGAPEQYYKRIFRYNNADGTNIIPRPAESPINTDVFPSKVGEPDYEQDLKDFYDGNTDTEAGKIGVEYGMHESYEYYEKCRETERNMGVSHLDQSLRNTRAISTRQNQGALRFGFECAEERDYYPYWSPSVWKDIAVFPTKMQWCEYYQTRSQNVQDRYFCDCDSDCVKKTNYRRIPIAQDTCEEAGGVWAKKENWGIDPPDCIPHPYSADNHLGNAYKVGKDDQPVLEDGPPEIAYYEWTIPEWMAGQDKKKGQLCVLRMRYNITNLDFNPQPYLSNDGTFLDSNSDCDPNSHDTGGNSDERLFCKNTIVNNSVPLYDRPYVRLWDDLPELSLSVNTDQTGRCFQDRTFVFRVSERPEEIPPEAKIWNLNTRGKKGHLHDIFPSSDYMFTPDRLVVSQGDWISVNLHSSWFNVPSEENGEGWKYSDAHNIMQADSPASNFPSHKDNINMFSNEIARELAMPQFNNPPIGPFKDCNLTCCQDFMAYSGNEDDYNNALVNCGKMNHAPNLFSKDFVVDAEPGKEYFYIGTRNNNFSNRSQKGSIFVQSIAKASIIFSYLKTPKGVIFLASFVAFANLFIKKRLQKIVKSKHEDYFENKPRLNV